MVRTLLHSLESWLWRRGFHAPQTRAMMLWQLCAAACSLCIGISTVVWTSWFLCFAVGMCIFAFVFWGIARHVSGLLLTAYSSSILMVLFLRMTVRMLIVAAIVYAVLVVFSASAIALVCGLTANMAVALGVFARFAFAQHKEAQ